MPPQMTSVKLGADTIRSIDHLARLMAGDKGGGGRKSRHQTIRGALQLSMMVMLWWRAKEAGETTQSLQDFLSLASVAIDHEFGGDKHCGVR